MARVSSRQSADGAHVRVNVVDSDPLVRKILAEHLARLEFDALGHEDLQALLKTADPSTPLVVVFGPSDAPDETIEKIKGLVAFRPGVGAIMIVHDLSTTVLKQALRADIDDVVSAEADDSELRDAVARSISRVVVSHASQEQPTLIVSSSEKARVITVCGTKGGTGKSVVATNLATALAKRTTQPVVLIDADLQFGDVALMMQLQPTHTIADAVTAGERLDGMLLERLLLTHPSCGLMVLAAPTESESVDLVTGGHLAQIVSLLRDRCAYVVIDTPSNYSDVTREALVAADEVLVVAGLDVMSLKSARLGVETMQRMGVSAHKIRFVLNRANSKVGLTERDAERAVQFVIDTALPSDVVVAESVNRGIPVVMSAPRSRFARSIDELAKRLMISESSPGTNDRNAQGVCDVAF